MHALVLLTAVLASLPPTGEAPTSTRHDVGPSLMLPDSPRGRDLHLLDEDLDTYIHDGGGEESAAGRIVVESLVGFASGAVGSAIGSLAFLVSPSTMGPGHLALPLSLQVLGTSLGVSFTGRAMEGRGSFGFTLLGSFLGLVVPLAGGTALMLAEDCRSITKCSAFVPTVIGMVVLPTVGATLAFELSTPKPWLSQGSASRAPRAAPRVVPVMALATEGVGGTLGLAGTF